MFGELFGISLVDVALETLLHAIFEIDVMSDFVQQDVVQNKISELIGSPIQSEFGVVLKYCHAILQLNFGAPEYVFSLRLRRQSVLIVVPKRV